MRPAVGGRGLASRAAAVAVVPASSSTRRAPPRSRLRRRSPARPEHGHGSDPGPGAAPRARERTASDVRGQAGFVRNSGTYRLQRSRSGAVRARISNVPPPTCRIRRGSCATVRGAPPERGESENSSSPRPIQNTPKRSVWDGRNGTLRAEPGLRQSPAPRERVIHRRSALERNREAILSRAQSARGAELWPVSDTG